jgi:hypothetical protein
MTTKSMLFPKRLVCTQMIMMSMLCPGTVIGAAVDEGLRRRGEMKRVETRIGIEGCCLLLSLLWWDYFFVSGLRLGALTNEQGLNRAADFPIEFEHAWRCVLGYG